MGLVDFERELAEESLHKSKNSSKDGEDRQRHRHRHHHRSRKHEDDDDRQRRHKHKRRRDGEDDQERRHTKRQRSHEPEPTQAAEEEVEDEWVEKDDEQDVEQKESKVQRDAWMQEPSALDIDYVQRKEFKPPPGQFVAAKQNNEFKVHENHAAEQLQRDFDSDEAGDGDEHKVEDTPAQHDVSYTFGDSGSSWRMTKLNAVYRQAEEKGRSVDDVALERYGDLRDFDDAREEERELERRKMYGRKYVGLEKPSGEFFQERKMKAGLHRQQQENNDEMAKLLQAEVVSTTAPLDSTALNKLKAQLMKAKLRNAPNASQLEAEYNKAASEASQANPKQPDVILLNRMDNRQLAGGRGGEVTAINGKRGTERGLVEENEDMSIDDMVRQEKRTHSVAGGEGKKFAERIAKDAKFENDLEYIDDNATKLSKQVVQSDSNLRNVAIGEFQQMQKILDSCPLCHHEDRADTMPTAPVVSLATRTYLTLSTEPEIAKGGAVIVPIQHRLNLLECDDDEWEEMRNFMKSLTRHYDAQGKGVLFYENAAHMRSRKGHAALNAIPLPHHLADTAPAYFKEAILAADEQWSQHKPVIDTLALTQKVGYGKQAFRKSMVKEMPYFHVWFGLDGGLGHVVEDERRWPKGDLFAREILGGMLDRGPEVVKRQGRWERHDRRVEAFRKKWAQWDWTKVLMEGQ